MSLAKRITQRRDELKLSQSDLVRKMRQIDPTLRTRETTISAIENGRSKNPTILYQLAMALGVTEAWLKTGKEPKFPARMTSLEIDEVIEHIRETISVAFEMLGLSAEDAQAFAELVLEVAQEPIAGGEAPTLRERRILAASLSRRFLQERPPRTKPA